MWPRRPGHPSRPRRLMRPTRPGHPIQSWGITHAEGGSHWSFRFLGTSMFGHFSVPGIDIRTHRVELRRVASVSHVFDPNTQRFDCFSFCSSPPPLPLCGYVPHIQTGCRRTLSRHVHRMRWAQYRAGDFQYHVDIYTCKIYKAYTHSIMACWRYAANANT